ncbi:pseudouridine synthase Rsu [Emticicia oligotrophica DSM 17448]|uniref:Pseudouridine synthase n=1 Tax=Emticicia oligotrophica (strain DSM 17448 / CIP 109782 / MTCC 6937 / GPTSA100-15) TaxID=929562 RepID=A0ABN4AN24_EMTOG|nr:pseudouridine synthase [Emticicia oligotrophica]AFK03562.1 pseudouridine synthase Rsu [Emticicia oligotrophica DSM 17448]
MTFRNRLQYLLVVRLQISNKEALALILSGKVLVNGLVVKSNCELSQTDEVVFEGKILQESKKMIYVAYYKPRGIETTLNTQIEDNLKEVLPFEEELFPVGRLDKASEGLLLLTNDGTVYDKILRNENKTEKDYIVEVDKPINDEFVELMSSGIVIMGKKTLPCEVVQLDDCVFKITLVQGLNRQIRRMCYKLNYEVLSLKRVRIGNIDLGDLKAGEYRFLDFQGFKTSKV